LHHGENVRIDAEGDFDALMPEPLLDHMHGDPGLQEQCGTSMPESMKLDRFDPRLGDESFKFPLANGVTLQRMPQRIAMGPHAPPVFATTSPKS
jgi:hypothetical protein